MTVTDEHGRDLTHRNFLWVIFDENGNPDWRFMDENRRVAQARYLGGRTCTWKQLYRAGYRCRKMEVTVRPK